MKIHYIFHSGFLVETETCSFVFDYYKGELCVNPDKPVIVFASHAHADHYNPEVFSLLARAGARDVTAVLAKDIKKTLYPEGIEAVCVRAGEEYKLLDGTVSVKTLQSTDSGVAFLLKTDEGVIYHAGDLNDWTWEGEAESDNRQMRGSYRHEIDKLAGMEIDCAFVPLDPRLDAHYADGLLYFLKKTRAKAVFPMHYWKKPDVIKRFLAEHPEYEGIIKYTEDYGF